MNQPYARVNQPYATLTLASPLREMFGVQLYKNNARALLSRISSILNLDWLQHARTVRGVYEYKTKSFQMTQGGYQVIIILPIKSKMAAAKKQCFLRFLYWTESSSPLFKVRGLQMTINLALV